MPWIGIALIALAYLIPVRGKTLWINGQWDALEPSGKFALIALLLLALTYIAGLRQKSSWAKVAMTLVPSILAPIISIFFLGYLLGPTLTGLQFLLSVLAFGAILGALSGRVNDYSTPRLSALAVLGAVLTTFVSLISLAEWSVAELVTDDDNFGLISGIIQGYGGPFAEQPAHVPNHLAGMVETITLLAFVDSIALTTILLVAVSGFAADRGTRAFVLWRKLAAPVLCFAIVVHVGVQIGGSLLLGMEDALLLILKCGAAIGSMALLLGTALGSALESPIRVRAFARRVLATLKALTRLSDQPSDASTPDATKLAAQLDAIDAMRTKGQLSDEEAESMRQSILSKFAEESITRDEGEHQDSDSRSTP